MSSYRGLDRAESDGARGSEKSTPAWPAPISETGNVAADSQLPCQTQHREASSTQESVVSAEQETLDHETGATPVAYSNHQGVLSGSAVAPRKPVENGERLIGDIEDIYEFGEAVSPHLIEKECHALARDFVKLRGSVVRNYEEVVTRYIELHGRGPAKVTNVTGLLFYLLGDKEQRTCQQLLVILLRLFGPSIVREVEAIVAKTKFSDT